MNKTNIPDFFAIEELLKKDFRRHAKVYCLQWFDDSFQNQGFTDSSFQPWDPRKRPDRRPGGAILIDTIFLRKSLDSEETENSIEFGAYAPYAALHNDGLRLRVMQNVRAHHRTKNGKRHQVKGHSRKMDVQYPKRQFIGESKLMMQDLENWFFKELEVRFKQ